MRLGLLAWTGPAAHEPSPRDFPRAREEGRWYLWHGNVYKALQVVQSIEMDLDAAADLMIQHHIRRLPLLDDGELAGIVTIDDVAVRAGDLDLAQRVTAEVAKGAIPEFFFHRRGG